MCQTQRTRGEDERGGELQRWLSRGGNPSATMGAATKREQHVLEKARGKQRHRQRAQRRHQRSRRQRPARDHEPRLGFSSGVNAAATPIASRAATRSGSRFQRLHIVAMSGGCPQ